MEIVVVLVLVGAVLLVVGLPLAAVLLAVFMPKSARAAMVKKSAEDRELREAALERARAQQRELEGL